MDASQHSFGRTLRLIVPVIVWIVVPNCLFVDASTRVEVRSETTFQDTDGSVVRRPKLRAVRLFDFTWRLGPIVTQKSTTTTRLLVQKTGAKNLGEAADVLLARARSQFAFLLLPVVVSASLLIQRFGNRRTLTDSEISGAALKVPAITTYFTERLKTIREVTAPGRRRHLQQIILTAGLPLVVLCAVIGVFLLFRTFWPPEVFELARWYRSMVSGICPFIYVSIAVPVAEEIVFRAGICRYLVERLGRRRGLLLQALIFASVHLATPLHILVGFIGGTVLGMAYVRSQSLTAAIAVHAGANCLLAVACLTLV